MINIKRPFLWSIVVAVIAISTTLYFSLNDTSVQEIFFSIDAPQTDPEERRAYDLSLIVNPETGLIPDGVYQAEREWALSAPKKLRKASNTYTAMGPDNLGGRTRAIAFDVRGSDTMLAGGVSSGVFRSTDKGATWTKVSPSNEIHNVTTIVQDPRSGNEDTWYYAGGEASGNSASNSGSSYMGNGVYKSTDNGLTWTRLSASNPSSLETFNWFSDFVQRLSVDPTNGDVYMACLGSIYRSTNGGTSWSVVHQLSNSSINTGWQTDIIITPGGRKYIAYAGGSTSGGTNYDGVWVSQTGSSSSWVQIAGGAISSPTGWDTTSQYGRVVLAFAPSDTAKIYALYHNNTTSSCSGTSAPEANLFSYNNGTTTWTDLSAYLPDEGVCSDGNDPFACQGGYDLCIAVKPNSATTVFIGGTNAYRSTDGFTSTSKTTRIGGYASASGYSKYTNHHPDIHTFAFDPDDSDSLYTGSDGGIHKSDISISTPAWTSLNNNYQTYQYYYVSIAPDAYKKYYIGGCQDNGTVRSINNSASQSEIFSGDGCATGIAEKAGVYTEFVSFQNGNVYRRTSDLASGYIDKTITPSGYSSSSNFVTYFHLDPDNTEYLYYANGDNLVRNTSATSATTTTGWTNMTGANAVISGDISSFATTRGSYSASTSSLFIGTESAKLYRLDDPVNAAASATPVDITPTGMTSGILKDISVNPRNDDTIMVVYSNYGVTSIWWTGNANNSSPTWVNIEGNVSIPSVRSCEIVQTTSGFEYYIGTSVGLYSTSSVSGTVSWSQEGSATLAYALVTTMDYRPKDNSILIGSHGNGLYLAEIGNAVERTAATSKTSVTMYLDGNEKKLFETAGGAIAEIENLDNFDYGLTTVEIDNTGSTGRDFSTNTASSKEITDKTIKITPTNANASGNVKITMYFSATELSGWKTATGWGAKDLSLIKSPDSIGTGTIANSVEAAIIVLDSTYNGNGLQITGTFSNGFSGLAGGKGGSGGPLPVTFVNFDLEKITTGVQLNWSTANELNNDRFVVLRKIDNKEWLEIGVVSGQGNSQTLQTYSFVDLDKGQLENKSFCYKIKQVDFDGEFKYTKTRCLATRIDYQNDIVITPNPAKDFLNIYIDPWTEHKFDLTIYDINGREVIIRKMGIDDLIVDISALKIGTYYMVLQTQDQVSGRYTHRFLKE